VMSNTDDYWYCPFAYGYSNYSRDGYAKNVLLYADLVHYNGVRLRSTVGGTGLAVSAFSKHKDVAVKFAEEIVSGKCQSTFYVEHGGQPGHRSAWENESANRLCNDYFKNVLPTMDNGYIRPRYNGYLHFQDHGGDPVREYLMNGGDERKVLQKLNELYIQSKANA
jgi:multiple sugar transport system substrate-binding protein